MYLFKILTLCIFLFIENETKLNLGEKQSNRNQSLKYGFKTVCESLKASKLRRKEITISEDTIDLNKIFSDGIFDFNMEVKLTNFSLDATENTNNLVTYSFEEVILLFISIYDLNFIKRSFMSSNKKF